MAGSDDLVVDDGVGGHDLDGRALLVSARHSRMSAPLVRVDGIAWRATGQSSNELDEDDRPIAEPPSSPEQPEPGLRPQVQPRPVVGTRWASMTDRSSSCWPRPPVAQVAHQLGQSE